MILSKKELQQLATRKEVTRVMKKFLDRTQTKIALSTGEIKVISKIEGCFEI